MPKRIAPLSELKIKKAKPAGAPYKLADGDGLYLYVSPSGGKLWRFDYTLGKRCTLSMGSYPEISIEEARDRRKEARALVAHGVDPNTVKKIKASTVKKVTANSFEVVAREWHERFKSTWCEKHGYHKLQRLESNIFPWIGTIDIADVEAPDLLEALRRVETRGAGDLASRIRTSCVQVFSYAIATGRCKRNVAADLKGALAPVSGGHHAAITEPVELAGFLRSVPEYRGSFLTISALKLLPLFFCRPGELRQAEWIEFDFVENIWNVPAGRMKMKNPHIVPLSKQAISVLNELKQVTGFGKYVFPSQGISGRCMSDNTLNTALRRMGYTKDEVTSHGFRATARTILDEVLKVRVDLVEHQLAHAVKDPNGRAYNRTSFIPERRELMQQWADYLDGLTRK